MNEYFEYAYVYAQTNRILTKEMEIGRVLGC